MVLTHPHPSLPPEGEGDMLFPFTIHYLPHLIGIHRRLGPDSGA